jgi:hypothetical protein
MLEIGLDFVIVMTLATTLLTLLGMTGITTSTPPSTVSTMEATEATEVGVVTAMKIEAEALTEVDMAGEETGSLRHPYCWFIPVK